MGILTVFAVVLVLILLSSSVSTQENAYKHTVCITDQESTSLSRTRNKGIICGDVCESLHCVTDLLQDSTDVVIFKPHLNLSISIKVIETRNIRFCGISENVSVSCVDNASVVVLNSINVKIVNISFDKCGTLQNDTKWDYTKDRIFLQFFCGIFIVNCTNVQLINVTVSRSPGKGVAIYNTNGHVVVKNCTFLENKVGSNTTLRYAMGGGLHIQFYPHIPSQLAVNKEANSVCNSVHNTRNSRYVIIHSKFLENENLLGDSYRLRAGYLFGRGGGLSIQISSCAFNNTIVISKCLFENNSAIWGAGLHAVIDNKAINNSVSVFETKFNSNSCPTDQSTGGGGVAVGFRYNENENTMNNTFQFNGCVFSENKGLFGGGANVFSSHSFAKLNNSFSFLNCTWFSNLALFGAAVDLTPKNTNKMSHIGTPALPKFENCSFHSNALIPEYTVNLHSNYATQHSRGGGTLISTGFVIHFNRNIFFSNNNGSAIQATSSTLRFGKYSNVTFLHNYLAVEGGAIALIRLSVIVVTDNSNFSFINNSASFLGGAISYSIRERHDYDTFHKCFLEYSGNYFNASRRNISFFFDGNKAGQKYKINGGNSIYATSFKICQRKCNTSTLIDNVEILSCMGNFTFTSRNFTFGSELTTSGVNFVVENSSVNVVKVIPGKETIFPFIMEDEFGVKFHSFYHVFLQYKHNDNISTGSDTVYISNNRTYLYGNPGTQADLRVYNMLGFYRTTLTIKVQLEHCPPGFFLLDDRQTHKDKILKRCVCSANTNKRNFGITNCNSSLFRAYLRRTFWVGYDKLRNESEHTLLSARCPQFFCKLFTTLLPATASRDELERAVCLKNRGGYLCGQCVNNFSTSYHSTIFKCESNESCQYGPLRYLVLDLLPVTALFLVVIVFDLRFTSGSTNGFIFFAQLVPSLNIQAHKLVWFPHSLYSAGKGYRFIYRLFTLDFLVDEYNFCLWKNAKTLDMLVIQYLSIVYSLALILVTVTVINKCNVRRIMCRCCIRIRRTRILRGSIIHGLTAFLILCYWKCTQVSFMLLKPACLGGPGKECNHGNRVFLYGDTEMFSSYHLKYAIPAFFFILVIAVLPPLLLLIHPLFYRVFALVDTEESKCVRITCKYFPMDTLKPLLDSFQGCFKDRYRYFSSFYFFYRLLILLILTFSFQLLLSYFLVQMVLIAILVTHAIIQPYKKRWHNYLDTILFADLLIVNGMTMYNYSRSVSPYNGYFTLQIHIIGAIQTVLIYLPLLYVIFYTIVYLGIKIIHTVRKKFKKGGPKHEHLPPLIVTYRTRDNDDRYDTFYEEAL